MSFNDDFGRLLVSLNQLFEVMLHQQNGKQHLTRSENYSKPYTSKCSSRYIRCFLEFYIYICYIQTSWRFYNTMVIPITQPSQRAGVAATTRQNFSRCSSCGDVQKNVRLSYANCEFMWMDPVKIGFLNIKHILFYLTISLSLSLSPSPSNHQT